MGRCAWAVRNSRRCTRCKHVVLRCNTLCDGRSGRRPRSVRLMANANPTNCPQLHRRVRATWGLLRLDGGGGLGRELPARLAAACARRAACRPCGGRCGFCARLSLERPGRLGRLGRVLGGGGQFGVRVVGRLGELGQLGERLASLVVEAFLVVRRVVSRAQSIPKTNGIPASLLRRRGSSPQRCGAE